MSDASTLNETGAEAAQPGDAWREALTDPGTATPRRTAPPAPTSHRPSLGYGRPGFSSPDYTSPDFEGPTEGTPIGKVTETVGAGAVAVALVLIPVLAGAVAVLSLIVGLLLTMLSFAPTFARILLTVAWVSGAVMGAGIVVAAAGLLVTALRNIPPLDDDPGDELGEEAAQPGDAWREALTDPGTATPRRTAPPAPTSRRPPAPRPSLTGPDFGGPTESTPSTGSEHPE
ncbi:hypothetical protein [Streptomyces sp. NPDC097610]|uniref:hypothetical protein n=1 Tax=Streptomyces sp. NPDC097610 TaxID=3157227 RepID=UPI00331B8C2A